MNGYSNGPVNRGVAGGPNRDWRITNQPSLHEADPRGIANYWKSPEIKQFNPILSPTGYIPGSSAYPRG